MLVTPLTRKALEYRRAVKLLGEHGYIRISENGDPLWRFYRGSWDRKKIVDVKIAPGGQELWIKVDGS